MLSKNQIKYIQSLRTNKFRKQHNHFIAEGNKIVLEIVSEGILKTHNLLATTDWLEEHKRVLNNIQTEVVTTKEIKKISQLKTPQDVIAIIEIPKHDIALQEKGVSLVLDSIRDPGNLGTIIRTADWFGVSQIICSQDCVDSYNPKVIQASMGSIARIQPIYVDLASFLLENREKTTIYACSLDGDNIKETNISPDSMIIIGNEANGISAEIEALAHQKLLIPKSKNGKAESLNASIAAAIMCYELSK